MGSVAPSQMAQPAGAKLPANILISPMYGEAMSVLTREYALQGDDPAEDEIRRAILVRLAAADVADAGGLKRGERVRGRVGVVRPGEQGVRRTRLVRVRLRRLEHVRVRG